MKKGFVYKINFPDGRFYIGATYDIKKRMKVHMSSKQGEQRVIINESFDSLSQLLLNVEVLYEGSDYILQEIYFIASFKGNKKLRNKKFDIVDEVKLYSVKNDISINKLSDLLGYSSCYISFIRSNRRNDSKAHAYTWGKIIQKLNKLSETNSPIMGLK